MTDLRQAAQQALECIEHLNTHGWILADFEDEVYAAITALKVALEQSEPLPQRTWVGLKEEDLDYLCHLAYTGDEEFVLTVQARLEEKNT